MSLRVEDWGFSRTAAGGMRVGGVELERLAREHGTPVHVIDEEGLKRRARRFREAFESAHPRPAHSYYALKCNNTPAVARMVFEEGLKAEVGTLYEWELARRLGVPPESILVNGPHKGALLSVALAAGAGYIVADGPADLEAIETAARESGRNGRILLRVNPDCVPGGMNRATATASRKNSVFGFDLKSGEVEAAFRRVAASPHLVYGGLHCHVGTGIRRAEDYERPLARLVACAAGAERLGLAGGVLDVGGGFGVATAREFETAEFLLYQALGRLPRAPESDHFPGIERFAEVVTTTVAKECARHSIQIPPLLLEPGRAVASGAGVLLVTVGALKRRPGAGSWAIADGGAGTVAFPLFYEYHEVFLCRDVAARRAERYTIVGPACFSADWICRNKRMPALHPGDILAICDAGAYFTVQESNFGFPRPAIVGVRDGSSRILRRRERFEDMVSRDVDWENGHVA